jgi:hypothetical protein
MARSAGRHTQGEFSRREKIHDPLDRLGAYTSVAANDVAATCSLQPAACDL